MSEVVVVADLVVKAGSEDFAKAELHALVQDTRAEEGAIQYDAHQDASNPTHFFIYERWETRKLWQQHMNNPALGTFLAATEHVTKSLVVSEMTYIAV